MQAVSVVIFRVGFHKHVGSLVCVGCVEPLLLLGGFEMLVATVGGFCYDAVYSGGHKAPAATLLPLMQ